MSLIAVNRPAPRFRVWDGRHGRMRYPQDDTVNNPLALYPHTGIAENFLLQQEGSLAGAMGISLYPLTHPVDTQIVPLMDTGLVTGDTPARPIYEGDVISFTIRGATHGRYPDECSAAHVWWHTEDACWAFGKWVQNVGPMRGGTEFARTFTWWYTAQEDGFDHSTLRIRGNVFENPELIPSLGYAPTL
jgi:hypothetical protein